MFRLGIRSYSNNLSNPRAEVLGDPVFPYHSPLCYRLNVAKHYSSIAVLLN